MTFAAGYARRWNRLIDPQESGAYIQPLLWLIRKPRRTIHDRQSVQSARTSSHWLRGGAKGWARRSRAASPPPGPTFSSAAAIRTNSKPRPPRYSRETGGRVAWAVTDQTRRADADALVQAALEKFGRVDILVNNAGSNTPQPIDQIRDEDWDRIVELNLNRCMALSRAVVPQMKERAVGPDHSHFVDHGVGLEGGAQLVLGDESRRCIGLARARAIDLGRHRDHRQLHRAGPVPDRPAGQMLSAEEKKGFADRTALGRWGDPRELVGPALLLASDAGSYITGTTLVVDGGTLCNTF